MYAQRIYNESMTVSNDVDDCSLETPNNEDKDVKCATLHASGPAYGVSCIRV